MSHSPLLNLPGPAPDLLEDIRSALTQAHDFVRAFEPELVVLFSPDHYNGFFYRLMPPFCVGTAASGVGDYGTRAGPLNVPADLATDCAQAIMNAGVDVAISASMDVDHGTVQPLEALFDDAAAVPVIPIFINSVATPLGPIGRARALGAAVGDFLADLDKRVLVVGSGGLSHDPPVPTLATAPPAALGRIVHGEPMSADQRAARQSAVIAAAQDFARGDSPLQPLNPDWDQALLELLDTNRVADVDGWSNDWIAAEAGNSAHEIRTWIAAYGALAAGGPYETRQRYYRAAPELIAGFAVRTAVTLWTAPGFDHEVDVLVVGSGGGGMTAALKAAADGLNTLVVEKSPQFGGSTALSGGGIWVPGAPSQRRAGYTPPPDGVFDYLKTITKGLVSDARLRQYVDEAPEMMEFLEKTSPWFEFVWKPGYADYYPETPGGSERGSTINVPEIDLRTLGDEERNLLTPLALAPKGIWFAPKDLRLFYQVRQSWRGKAVLVKLIWRMFRARVFGDRMAAIGQSLMARMRLALKEQGTPLWLNAPMTELLTDVDGNVIGAVVERDGSAQRIRARGGVVLACGGFDHDMAWRREHLPELQQDWSFGNPAATGDGIRAGEKVGGSLDLLDEAWWFPAICWPDGRLQFMLNERMMPAQFVVNGAGERFVNEAAPYMDFAHAMIAGQRTGVEYIPCWLVTDIRSFHRYVVAGHLPIPKVPFAPVPTGRKVPQAWLDSGVVKQGNSFEELATAIGVPADQLRKTADRFNELARDGHDDDFNRGDSAYDNYYGDPGLANPNLHPLGKPPYYAFQIILGDLGTSGGLRTDAHARVLRADDSVIGGLYATGNATAAVMGRSYAGAGATIGPAMTFGYVAAKHIRATADDPTTTTDSTPSTYRR